MMYAVLNELENYGFHPFSCFIVYSPVFIFLNQWIFNVNRVTYIPSILRINGLVVNIRLALRQLVSEPFNSCGRFEYTIFDGPTLGVVDLGPRGKDNGNFRHIENVGEIFIHESFIVDENNFSQPLFFEGAALLNNDSSSIYDGPPLYDTEPGDEPCNILDTTYIEPKNNNNYYYYINNDSYFFGMSLKSPFYRLKVMSHVRTADIFEAKYFEVFFEFNTSGDKIEFESRANRFKGGENDGDEIAIAFLKDLILSGTSRLGNKIFLF